MDHGELLSAYIAIGDKIDVLWSMYLTIVFTASAWLYYKADKKTHLESIVVYSGFLTFTTINANALVDSYGFLSIIQSEMTNINTSNFGTVQEYLREINYENRYVIVYFIHTLIAFVFLFAIFFPRLFSFGEKLAAR